MSALTWITEKVGARARDEETMETNFVGRKT